MTFEEFLKRKLKPIQKFEQLQIQVEIPNYPQKKKVQVEPERGVTVIDVYGETEDE